MRKRLLQNKGNEGLSKRKKQKGDIRKTAVPPSRYANMRERGHDRAGDQASLHADGHHRYKDKFFACRTLKSVHR